MPVLVRSNRATDLTPNRRRGAAAAPEMHLSSCREPPSAAESGTSACEKKTPCGLLLPAPTAGQPRCRPSEGRLPVANGAPWVLLLLVLVVGAVLRRAFLHGLRTSALSPFTNPASSDSRVLFFPCASVFCPFFFHVVRWPPTGDR